jgi:fructokinase
LNDSELETITAMPTQSPAECQMAALELKRRHPEANLIVTRGPRGVLGLFADGEEVWQDATAPKRMVDSVGAGDAFSAVLMLGILRDWERGAILRSAVAFAADVCGQQGAIAEDAAIYAHRFD